jgi:phage tail sheath protein FI
MPITPTYPGIYIEELPSSAHTITAAATSITVFVGYTHPFKTRKFNTAVQLFSFTDFEREFGGLFASNNLDSTLAYTVNQFFLNGGSIAWVVGLQPSYYDKDGKGLGAVAPANLDMGNGIIFTALEPTDVDHPISVTISHLQASDPKNPNVLDVGDISIAYGSRVERYRTVTINKNPVNPADKQNFIETRIGTLAHPVSSLVAVPDNGTYTAPIASSAQENVAQLITGTPPPGFATTFSEKDFTDVFQPDSDLDKLSIFNLLVIPGVADNAIWSAAIAFCERKQAFFIMDPPAQDAADLSSGLPLIETFMNGPLVAKSTNGAIYFPYLLSLDPLTGNTLELPPSGFVAGIYARTDANRGVWKAPAGLETTILNTTGLVARGRMTDMRQGTLNQIAVNCLRTFPGVGTVVFGARTLEGADNNTAFQQWKYVPVRRMALFIEQTLYRNLGWVVFEPNDDPLWVAIRTSIENFMLSLFQQGAFQGSTPSKAFQVKCDSQTTTQTDIDNGIVNIIVAFAPLKPAEFVIIKIAQLAGQSQA